MSEATSEDNNDSAGCDSAGIRERLVGLTEDRLGRAFSDALENPLLTGAIGRAFDAREKAAQAQELAMAALNLPSAADIERLTRRLRSVSQRLEAIEDVVDRIDHALGGRAVERRLAAIEEQLRALVTAATESPENTPAAGAPKRKSAPMRAKARPPREDEESEGSEGSASRRAGPRD